jgi:hypothetical protein
MRYFTNPRCYPDLVWGKLQTRYYIVRSRNGSLSNIANPPQKVKAWAKKGPDNLFICSCNIRLVYWWADILKSYLNLSEVTAAYLPQSMISFCDETVGNGIRVCLWRPLRSHVVHISGLGNKLRWHEDAVSPSCGSQRRNSAKPTYVISYQAAGPSCWGGGEGNTVLDLHAGCTTFQAEDEPNFCSP